MRQEGHSASCNKSARETLGYQDVKVTKEETEVI